MNNELKDKLKEIKIENFIWLIYIGIIFFSWYSNSLEKDYFINNNINSKNKYRKIMIAIFIVLNIVYTYFLFDSKNGLDSLKVSDSDKKKTLTYLSFIASLFISISGIILLYIAYKDDDLNVEIAFN